MPQITDPSVIHTVLQAKPPHRADHSYPRTLPQHRLPRLSVTAGQALARFPLWASVSPHVQWARQAYLMGLLWGLAGRGVWKHHVRSLAHVGVQQNLDGLLLIAYCTGTLPGQIMRKIRLESLTLSLVSYVTLCKLVNPFGPQFLHFVTPSSQIVRRVKCWNVQSFYELTGIWAACEEVSVRLWEGQEGEQVSVCVQPCGPGRTRKKRGSRGRSESSLSVRQVQSSVQTLSMVLGGRRDQSPGPRGWGWEGTETRKRDRGK